MLIFFLIGLKSKLCEKINGLFFARQIPSTTYKCKQFYFIFLCSSKHCICFVNTHNIQMFLYLILLNLLLVLPSRWYHKFLLVAHKVLCNTYKALNLKAYNKVRRATNIISHSSSESTFQLPFLDLQPFPLIFPLIKCFFWNCTQG